MTLTAEEFRKAYAALEAARAVADKASEELATFPKGPMGLTPDSVKFTPEFQTVRQTYDAATAKVKRLSAVLVKADKAAMRALARRNYKRGLSAADQRALERVGLA